MEVYNCIKSIINCIDQKLNAKTMNLISGVKILCKGYKGVKGTDYKPMKIDTPIEICKRICQILDGINQNTGFNDDTLTNAVQRLCDEYIEFKPLYSFGLLSDLHIQYETGVEDFQRALSYLKDNVPFTCVCGDLVSFATVEHMQAYKNCVDNYAGDMDVYECTGNHESYPALGVGADVDVDLWTAFTGKELYYSFTYNDDVFIFVGMKSERSNDLFPDGTLEWLQSTLEENSNKRCFVFMHAPELKDRCADPSGTWSSLMGGKSGKEFINLIKQYKNLIWFHGHTHVTFGVEQYPASDVDVLGYRSVHIPSLVSPRFYDEQSKSLQDYYIDENGNRIWGSTLSEGYIVDVYENKIVLRGINFAGGSNKNEVESLLDEVYALDTTL